MAAVAGASAQAAAEAALEAGACEAIVDNGGDIFLYSEQKIVIGLYAGTHSLSGRLAFEIMPVEMPLAVCSSSSCMGHSLSLGDCDLATAVGKDAALADAAATLACNLVREPEDLGRALEKVMAIQGVQGVLIVKEGKVGIMGELPKLIRHEDKCLSKKIPKDQV